MALSSLSSINGYAGLVNSPRDNNAANQYAAQQGAARAYGNYTKPVSLSSGNILTVYNADISLSFNGESIKREQISYILMDNDYDDRTMPIIYVSFAATNSMYDSILANKDSATFYLSIYLKNANYETTTVEKCIYKGEFTYIPSSTSPNYTEILDDSNMEKERQDLWDSVNVEVDNQVQDVVDMLLTLHNCTKGLVQFWGNVADFLKFVKHHNQSIRFRMSVFK